MKPKVVAFGVGAALLILGVLRAAQSPTYEARPDAVTKIVANLEFDAAGTMTAFMVVATVETPLINTSDLRDRPKHKAGEVALDLLASPDRAAMLNEELIAAVALKEWLRTHPQVFVHQRRNLREATKPPDKGPGDK